MSKLEQIEANLAKHDLKVSGKIGNLELDDNAGVVSVCKIKGMKVFHSLLLGIDLGYKLGLKDGKCA